MAGELVPLVMIPRYTTYAGAADYATVGMDVTEYDSAILNIWRGEIVVNSASPTPAFKVNCEESTDQNSWSTCDGTTADTAVAQGQEKQFVPALNKRWFRVRITVAGDLPVVTCWAVGYLEQRQR